MGQRNYLLDFCFSGISCQLAAVTPEYEVEKQGTYHIHRHYTFELHAVFQGSVCFRIGNQRYDITANQAILIAPGAYHSIQFISDDLDKMCLMFELPRPEHIRGEQQAQLSAVFYAQEAAIISTTDFQDSLHSICAVVQRYPNTFWDTERLKAAMILLILNMLDKLNTPISIHRSAPQPPSQATFVIDEFFNLHYNLNNGNQILARQLHMSTRQLDRVLQKYYNMSYREKLLDIRLTNAMDFLLNTDKSIAEISELIGYSTPANFSAFIKKATGKSPSEIRNSHAQD